MFKRIILRYKASIWFLPSIFILGSIFLSIVITESDKIFINQFNETFPVFLYTSIDFARTILSVIATSLLTMTAIIFSTIMIVFSMYAAQYSPNYRNTDQDIVFSLEKLEEIALRAISTGINDPNTAIHCIRNLADILLEISKSYTGKLYFYDKEENLRFVLNDKSFEEILYSTFYKILNFSRNMISILDSILESIIIISEAKNDKIKKILYDFTVYAINGFDIKLLQDHDIQFLNLKIKKIAKNLNINQSKILIS